VNPATAFSRTFTDELARCGMREVVIAPGSRSTPLAMAFLDLEQQGRLRLHVRIDERSASFTALGLAKVSGRPVAVLCTSGTAAANFHPAVIEADESGVPLLLLTADRPPELRGTGANQAIDQIKLYGSAVRWFCEAGVPEREAAGQPGAAAYWRSLAGSAWAHAAGRAGGFPGPVHLNLPFRDPLVPDAKGPDGSGAEGRAVQPLDGRPDGQPWTRLARAGVAGEALELPWTERGAVICGDGDTLSAGAGASPGAGAGALVDLAERAGWPVLAEPSSGARRGPNALSAYQYLLAVPEFLAEHQPDVIVSAGRPGLSRAQSAFLANASVRRHIVIAQGPDRWADPQRAATDVAPAVRLAGEPARIAGAPARGPGSGGSEWLDSWRRADRAARAALDAVLDEAGVSEPRLARDLLAALPGGALLWSGSSMPIRDLDCHMAARDDVVVRASRGASGIDGTVSAAIGAALAHGGPAYALIGDLAFLHDAAGLTLGPREPRPDLCLVVVNNDGGGIFSTLEQAAFDGFERLFGTSHGAALHHLAAAFGVPYQRLEQADDLGKAIQGNGLRMVEVRTDRTEGAALRARLRAAAEGVIRAAGLAADCDPR
jgi:2-succinyl-5-enolpyruvyl-6-hydroxy-3-cyclohexene-1-carboxylate synthase